MERAQEYYATSGSITAAGEGSAALRALPREIDALCKIVQGVLIHREGDNDLLDRVAALTLAGDEALPRVRAIYDDDRLRVPDVVFNADRQAAERISRAGVSPAAREARAKN